MDRGAFPKLDDKDETMGVTELSIFYGKMVGCVPSPLPPLPLAPLPSPPLPPV
jgi:hypothetical protein